MAEANVTLRVQAETKQAKKDIEDVAAAEKRLQSEAPGGGAGSGGGTPPVDTKQAARDMAEEFGKRAGVQLGKFIGSFLINQGVTTAFTLARKPGEDSRRLDQMESTLNGAISSAGAGAMVAGPIGAIVGGLLGGLNNFILKEKDIQDGIRQARLDYGREREYAKMGSRSRQEESMFDFGLRMMTPQQQVAAMIDREKSLIGEGSTWKENLDSMATARDRQEEVKKELERLRAERATATGSRTMQTGGIGGLAAQEAIRRQASKNLEDINRQIKNYEERLKVVGGDLSAWTDAINAALEGKTKDKNGNDLEIGGNKYGTRKFWETVYFATQKEFGDNDENTKKAKQQLDALNAKIDPLQERELGLYQSEMEKMLGFASRSAITDNLSSKGLIVGAQVGSMGNDRIVGLIQDFMKQAQAGNKSIVDVIRASGGLEGMRREFARVL